MAACRSESGHTLSLPEKLPLPHPHMLADQPVQTWVTTVTLDALREPVADGGIGADLDGLDITEAWGIRGFPPE